MHTTPKTITRKRLYATWLHQARHYHQAGLYQTALDCICEAMAVAKTGARKHGDDWADRLAWAAACYDITSKTRESAQEAA